MDVGGGWETAGLGMVLEVGDASILIKRSRVSGAKIGILGCSSTTRKSKLFSVAEERVDK